MARRLVLEADPSSPWSAVTGKLKELVCTADEAATLAGGAEAALLTNDDMDQASAGNCRKVNRGWLHAFQEAVYELDEAIDGHNSCVDRQQQQQPGERDRRSIRHWFSPSSTSVHETEYKRMKTIVEKLSKRMQEILQQGRQLKLQPIKPKRPRLKSEILGKTPCYDIVGDVENQKLNLIGMLTDKQSTDALENDQSTSHVVVIVGCGGTGKTTLARLVIDDHRTRNAFSTILWVRGSKDFTHMALLSAIATATGIKSGEAGSREKIEEMLASKLEGKRILLVLDDVWSHQVHENYLQSCLSIQHGSRILMTAWDRSVAVDVKSAQSHHVKELSLPHCWSLLRSSSCLDEQFDASLREIGKTLIEKCRRVPLAIKVIGAVLRTKDPTCEEWQKVSECEGWSPSGIPDGMKEMAGPICVAYNDLPSHLKQCLLYCLHLPEGFMISKLSVTRLWISESFIEEQQDCSPEDTAEEYYRELLLRYLLQPEFGSPDMARCTLYNCVRYVLRLLTKDLWTGMCRSMSSTVTQEKATLTCFRTVILHKNPSGDRVLDQVSRTVKHLRVLDLTGTGIRHIPGSMEPLLLHLRFLNLSHTDITELPESIGSLVNLQFLVLRYCYRLHSLPEGLSKLQNLRTLDLEGTAPRLVLPRLAGLKQLTMLQGFMVNSKEEATENDTSGWPLEDLKFLDSLRTLQIMKTERIQQDQTAQSAELSRKSQLTQLELCGSPSKVHPVSEEEDRRLNDVLSGLQPPQCLEYLKIVGYHGRSFPIWILYLLNLKQLIIADCNSCERLPDLELLQQLKLLAVSGCSELHTIERKRKGRPEAFPKLEQLHLSDLRSLNSCEGFEAGDLPSLAELHLQRCPSLRSLLPCLKDCRLLTTMLIVSADSLEAVDGIAALRELDVQDSKKLASISNLPALQALTVVDCSGLRNVSGLKLLKHLRVVDRELTSLPDWLTLHGSVPETLTIVGREVLLGRLVPGGKDWPAISGISKVYGNLPEGSPFFTYTKSTALLEAFGDRRDPINLADATDGNVARTLFGHQLRNWSPHVRIANFARRASQIKMPATKRWYLLGTLPVATYLLFLLLPSRYIEHFPIPVLLVLAFIGMLVFFTYGMLASSRGEKKEN